MPEGPEVKSLVNWLNYNLKNKNLLDINILGGRYKKHGPPVGWNKLKSELPLKIKKINCKGKFIWWEFVDSEITLWNTLGMSGWWYQEDYKHNNLEFKISKSKYYFNDVRNFGTFKICTKENLKKKLDGLGPDVFVKKDESELFIKKIIKKRDDMLIGSALLDQKVLSGVGNYMRADILYLSKVNPFKKLSQLNNKQLKLIYKNAKYIANRAFKIQNNKTYKDLIHPSMGDRFFFIYSMDTDPKGNKVKKDKLGTRTIHWVPEIQK